MEEGREGGMAENMKGSGKRKYGPQKIHREGEREGGREGEREGGR
jgi:hypothetical protein